MNVMADISFSLSILCGEGIVHPFRVGCVERAFLGL